EHKHNEANGEQNRDGHDDNLSWNNGVEGETGDRVIVTARFDDQCALLATLFASRGTIMLTAGDEFGRTQKGNNNAYAQDNEITWLDWAGRDQALEQYAVLLAAMRR
ncbi:MAG: glycogen debranching enzyme GlgX, partial [Mesorhizobium sp.]